MNLISSKTVNARENIFWEPLPEEWIALPAKRVLVLSLPFETDSVEESTLLKMLGGCALTQQDFNILQIQPGQRVAWHALNDHFKPKQIIMLGVESAQFGISAMFLFNEMNKFYDCTFIPSLSLQQLDQYPDAKKTLWLQALKPCFLPSA